MENKVMDAILTRRSIRAYKDQQLTQEQLDALVDTALISPTAMNLQHWHFTFLQNPALIAALEKDIADHIMATGDDATKERLVSRNYKVLYNAPTLVVISADNGKYAPIDSGIAVQSLAIAAKGMGLDSVILGMVGVAFLTEKADYWREKLQIPAGYEFTIAIAIGYGDMQGADRTVDKSKLTIIQ